MGIRYASAMMFAMPRPKKSSINTKLYYYIQEYTMYSMSQTIMRDYLSWDDILNSSIKQKFYSELLDMIYTRSEIIKIVRWDWNRTSDEDEFNLRVLDSKKGMHKTDWMGKPKQLSKKEKKSILPFDLVKLESKQFRRYDKLESRMRLHNSECELSESPSCSCWCSDQYHGLRYQRLPNEVVLNV